ncbi:MAG: citrate/2-methylcitrate synthase [Pseudomonadota bacterium]
MSTHLIEVPPGLKNVAVTDTLIGDVRGDEGFYHYREYSAIDLAQNLSLEAVWFLLFHGHLPDAVELDDFKRVVAQHQTIPSSVADVLPAIARLGKLDDAPLQGLRTALSLVATAHDMRPWLDLAPEARLTDAMKLCAVVPTLLAALHRLGLGLTPVEADPHLGYAENYLYMTLGEPAPAAECRAVEQYLISTIDHGFNASTFAARVIAGTGADFGACLVGAVGALSGPLHGGAPSRALQAVEDIGQPEAAADWVREQLDAGNKLMGFGHAVYRTEDPRSAMLKAIALQLGGPLVEQAIAIEQEILKALAALKPGSSIHTNVEYYAGLVMQRCGLPAAMFTPTFASSRVIGWSANVLEQAASNKIIRPAARYVGRPAPQPLPDTEQAVA